MEQFAQVYSVYACKYYCPLTRLDEDLLTAAKYCINSLVLSVLPAPDSPLITITCKKALITFSMFKSLSKFLKP